jgi:RNA polymerase sigma factor (sigma-70 family)
MKKLINPAGSRRLIAAVVVGTALTALAGEAKGKTFQPGPDAIQDISRYCQACWRNARLHPDSWSDCTQEVLVRLLQTVEADRWDSLLKAENEDRREFLRAIDAVKKRTQRSRKYSSLIDDDVAAQHASDSNRNELREELDTVSSSVLSSRQQRILQLTREGYGIPEIAQDMQMSTDRVSDEKYKAIRKLRKELKV